MERRKDEKKEGWKEGRMERRKEGEGRKVKEEGGGR